MKAFTVSMCVLALTIIFVIVNAFYFHSALDKFESLIYLLPSSPETDEPEAETLAIMEELEKLGEKYENYFQIFVPQEELRVLFSSLLEAGEYYRSGDFPSYLASLKLAKQCLIMVRLNESVDIGNII